jgi:tyrosine-protein phosphatase YwqE
MQTPSAIYVTSATAELQMGKVTPFQEITAATKKLKSLSTRILYTLNNSKVLLIKAHGNVQNYLRR